MSNNLIDRLRSGMEIHNGDWSMLDEAADEIESLRQQLAEAQKAAEQFAHDTGAMLAKRDQQLAEAQQDAERYRWLAKGADEGDGGWLIEVFVDGAPSLETLDAAIDAAMKWGE